MMKSYEQYLRSAVFGVLDEYLDDYPVDLKEINRDKNRLVLLSKTRGLPVFTLDFPALGKHLDKCLSEGAYVKSDLPLSGTKNSSSIIPKLFSGIYLRIFDCHGMLRNQPCVDAIRTLRQIYVIGKKLRINCEERKVYETLNDFYKTDRDLPSPTLNWSRNVGNPQDLNCDQLHLRDYADGLMLRCKLEIWRRKRSRGNNRGTTKRSGGVRLLSASERKSLGISALDKVQQVADLLSSTLGFFDPYKYQPKHGNGAVSDLKGGEFKYSFPAWSEELEKAFPCADFAISSYNQYQELSKIEDGDPSSSLACVPKTQKGPRLIACEPVAHQWCQQIVWAYLDQRVSETWIGNFIKFRDQTQNQEMAKLASQNSTHWTVDLSAASDRVTMRMVERVFRRNPSLLHALISSRTPKVKQNIDRRFPSVYNLKKYTTMGSACTFPIESLIFLVLVISAIFISRDMKVSLKSIRQIRKDASVFGDDLIVPSDAGYVLELLLSHFSFKVNQAKTHRNGRFRESCGMEAYNGVDVTPAYILTMPVRTKPESIISNVECSNNFLVKGRLRTAQIIKEAIGIRSIPDISYDSGAFGFKRFSKVDGSNWKRRFNENLHREEFKVLRVSTRAPRSPIDGESVLLQFFTEDPDPSLPWSSGVVRRPRLHLKLGWESGEALGFTQV